MTNTAPSAPEAALGRRELLVVFIGLLLGLLIVGLDQTTVAVAAPTIVQDLGGLRDLPWVFTANLIAAAVAAPLFGKLSDLYGRRLLFNTALVAFLAGSAACGLAQTVGQLIAFRAVQGVGAGGMTAMVIVVIGDLVSPRARASYQGYIGAELALAQVLGPWLGGYLTDQASWRWVFYLNIPIGLLALAVTAFTLRLPPARGGGRIDWLGAALLVATLSCLMLLFSWGGQQIPWSSPQILLLALITLVLLASFLVAERLAADPIMPPRLFRNPVPAVALALMFLAGASLFSMTFYMPAVLQIVIGVSATNSGLLLFPLMAGVVATSILSGHVVAATGRYRLWPILGTFVATLGLLLLSRITPETGQGLAILYMVALGLGLGCIVQLMVVIVQNAVPRADLGIATATTGLFRILGGAVGAGLFGAVLNARLPQAIAEHLPQGALPPGVNPGFLAQNPQAAAGMPPPVLQGLANAFADTFQVVFLTAVPIGLAAFVLALFLRELPMRTRIEAPPPGPPDPGPAATAATPTTITPSTTASPPRTPSSVTGADTDGLASPSPPETTPRHERDQR